MKRLLFLSSCLLSAGAVHAQAAGMQSPAYQECTTLATSNPTQALAKADAWLKIDSGIAAQHCRAMALFGLHRFAEAGDALATMREAIAPEVISLRSYVARQAAQAYLSANSADKALAMLSVQINEIGNVHNDNVNAAKQTSNLLLERSRINISFGKLEDATKDLDHAVSLTPVNEEVLLERAGVFEKLGDAPLARNDVDAVLTINPNNALAKTARKRLSAKTAPAPELAAPAANAPLTSAAPETSASASTPSATPPTANTASAPVAAVAATPATTTPPAADTAVTPVSSSNVAAPTAPNNAAAGATAAPTSLPFVAPTAAPTTVETQAAQAPNTATATATAKKSSAKRKKSSTAKTGHVGKPALPVPGISQAP